MKNKAKFRKSKSDTTAESYFLAGRSLTWWMVGGSLFASNMGGAHFIGISGDAAATGIAVVSYEWQVNFCMKNIRLVCCMVLFCHISKT